MTNITGNMVPSRGLTVTEENTLEHLEYDEASRKLKANRAIETTLNSLYLGEQHKMSSGAENIFFTNLTSNINWYPVWGGLKDQSVVENQDASGYIPPSGRVYSDMISTALGGNPHTSNSIGYIGDNPFNVNISGLGITTVCAEAVPTDCRLVYELRESGAAGNKVYIQELQHEEALSDGDYLNWYFDHPVEIHAGQTIHAAIYKINNVTEENLGVLQVRQGDDGTGRYWATVHNRTFEDKDIEFISPYLKYNEMDFSLDTTGTTVVFTNPTTDEVLQPHPVNFLKAIEVDGSIQIKVKDGAKVFIESLAVTGAYIEGTLVNSDVALAVNQLNALFSQTGGSTGQAPVITSGSTITMQQGDTLNYELTATDGVAYEWSGLPDGVVTVTGNTRKLIGGSEVTQGTYTITAKAINYYGVDTQDITLTVSAPAFSMTKSVNFEVQDFLGANAALLNNVLGRSGNGSGSSEAWTISMWFKGGTNSNGQTVFYFGAADTTNGGYLELRFVGGTDRLRLRYGSNNNYIQLQTPTDSVPANVWKHIVVSYDGGTTGSGSGSLSNYYSRFKMYIDGVLQTTNNNHSNYGWSNGITGQNLRVGKFSGGSTMRDCRVHDLAVWDSDQSGNISDLYNNGNSQDLSDLSTPPSHWWRMGDDDTFPNIQDNVGSATFVMYNMTAANIVTDSP